MTTRLLLTRGLSNVRDAIDLIHGVMAPDEFHLGAAYATEYTPLRRVADSFVLEPDDPEPGAYIEWLLALCQERDFAWVWPQSRWSLLLNQQSRFAAAGVQLILPCPDTDTLDAVQDKARANARLAATGVALPQTLPVTTAADFNAALAILGDNGTRQVCVKPVRSIYGLGFRRIDDRKRPLDRFLANDCYTLGSAEFADLLVAAAGQRPFLAMEYLAGDERSIDCLAHQGRLVRAVVRRKPANAHGRWQLIEDDPEGREIARHAIAALSLHGLVNVQTRERLHPDGRREQCFLEVNPRMSGGMDMACQAGLNLPYWLLRLLVGTVEEAAIPWPSAGVRVAKIERAVVV
ncbi:ATP-grasp domain-containing protein [Candidatus Contendibacter odensensis]|uniref:ATP-grasp domain-containing protein n=1 Tax=Candidatus Contendibacter odensensis TaxID=1400860 RepID=UPI0018AA4A5C|nr:ATP-grasp domain-containing protein [Candidatus Contendobacter odensis]MBK8754292.1 ATP-grasp domain-containing protein [Candidatus Competibacteraceae bacterium]